MIAGNRCVAITLLDLRVERRGSLIVTNARRVPAFGHCETVFKVFRALLRKRFKLLQSVPGEAPGAFWTTLKSIKN